MLNFLDYLFKNFYTSLELNQIQRINKEKRI